MSANGENFEDAEMGECDGEKVLTMMDVLQEQQEFEDDANAVLGASDDKNCTYSQGYIKRQAVYACLTCCNDAKDDPGKRAGVCLACSLTCHENHDLVELYTKRNFCCDCGNPKFNHPCQYTQNKTTLNEDNIYNQNFIGLYCTCHRPYPDPDGVEEEMIQCIVCEDWLHASHLEATVPSSELYAEMICKACMEKNEFLYDYGKYAVNGDVDIVDISETVDSSIHCNVDINKVNGINAETEELKEATNPTEDNIDENNTEEHIQTLETLSENTHEENFLANTKQAKDVISDKADDEITTDENPVSNIVSDKADDKITTEENPVSNIVSHKADDETTTEGNPVSNIVPDKADDEISTEENPVHDVVSNEANDKIFTEGNSTDDVSDKGNDEIAKEENPPKDSNKSENLVSDEISHNNLVQDLNAAPSSTDQEYLKDAPIDSSENNEECMKDDSTAITTEQNQLENFTEIPQNTIESNGDGQQAIVETDKIDVEFKDSQEKQVPTDTSLISAANTNVEMDGKSHVMENHAFSGNEQIKEIKRKLSTEQATDEVSNKKQKLSESKCLRPQGQKKMFKGATFWPCHFRQKLCTCNECITMYKDLSVLFLIDPEDTVTAYELLGKEKANGTASTQYEKGLEALSSLGRIQQINALTEYNKMRDKLLNFLKSFKDRKEVVKEEDIKAFFAGMKPKREPDGVYFCR